MSRVILSVKINLLTSVFTLVIVFFSSTSLFACAFVSASFISASFESACFECAGFVDSESASFESAYFVSACFECAGIFDFEYFASATFCNFFFKKRYSYIL